MDALDSSSDVAVPAERAMRRCVSRMVIALFVAQAAGICAYWIVFWTTKDVFDDKSYQVYERSFPLADGFVVLNSLLCAYHLARSYPRPARRLALGHGLIAVGGMWFLGLEDILFNLENDMYAYLTRGTASQRCNMWLELGINVWCILGQAFLAFWLCMSQGVKVRSVKQDRSNHLHAALTAPMDESSNVRHVQKVYNNTKSVASHSAC